MNKKPFATYHAEQRRLCILKSLSESQAKTANSSLLLMVLEQFGLVTTADQVASDLAWLAEQGLVTTRSVADTVIATATKRGLSVASGVVSHPGVAEPSPSGE